MNKIIDTEVCLVPYYDNYNETIQWYQDMDVCKQIDNIDHAYSMDNLKAMYGFLSTHGDCYYIQYNGVLVGDVTLRDDGEVCIVICKEYQNRHIGRRCIGEMIKLAKEKNMDQVKAKIYSFNTQSKKMFLQMGFKQVEAEWYIYNL